MPDQSTAPRAPLTHENAAQRAAEDAGVEGALVILSHADGTMELSGHNVNHFRATELLARSMQITLNQHDDFVRAGAAGEAAQATQAMLDRIAQTAGGVQ